MSINESMCLDEYKTRETNVQLIINIWEQKQDLNKKL